MKSLRHIFLYCIIFFNNAPLASEIDNSYQKQSLLAVLFKRTSAEYKANTFQIYMSAKSNIDNALEDKSWTALINQNKASKYNIYEVGMNKLGEIDSLSRILKPNLLSAFKTDFRNIMSHDRSSSFINRSLISSYNPRETGI